MNKILLKFNNLELKAEIFDNKIGNEFYQNLPYNIELTSWGNELYGSIGIDLGEDSPVPSIPGGGLAYTNQGNYLCVFFGQTPAWSVEHIGRITDDWQILKKQKNLKTLIIERI